MSTVMTERPGTSADVEPDARDRASLPQWFRTPWRTGQLGVAVAGTLSFIVISSAFAALPDLTLRDRWQFGLEIVLGQFAAVALQLAALHLMVVTPTALRMQRALRFSSMVLLGTVAGSAALWFDPASIRLGILESTTTGVLSSLFKSLLTATFLVYQHAGEAMSFEASRRLQRLQREQRLARRRLVEAQLQALQARVDPQMFFDVLDSVQRLYAADPPRAEALLDELIVFLRTALPRLRSASSTLAQELEIAASYFRLQTLCGGTTRELLIKLPEPQAAHPFPAGVILPLLSDVQSAAIEVDAPSGPGADHITVSLHSRQAPAPLAIAQARTTLEALYGSAAKLECRETAAERPIETRITLAHDAT